MLPHAGKLLALLAVFLPVLAQAQLSGSYTINPTQSAGNTNYQNWASAVSDLLSGSRSDGGTAQGPGVNGAVVFTVYDTVYNNVSIEITAISGASASNTVTFRSRNGDSSRCVLKNASSSSSTGDFVLHLNGADYLRFEKIGFERTGTNTYCTVVQLSNDADYNTFTRCYLRGRRMPSSSSLGFQYGIGSCFYFTGNADYTEITQCRLLYGYNGIYAATTCSGNLFQRNTLDTSGSSGMYITSQTGLKVLNNQMRMGDFGANQGHYVSYALRIESSASMVVAGNRIQMLAVNGQVVRAVIIASTTSSAAAPTLVYNNFIYNAGGTGDCTGFAVYACSYLNFHHNNVYINSSLSSSAGYYHYPQYSNSYIRLVNNNFINKGSGYAINVPGTNINDIDSLDYNNYFSNGTNLGNWNATNYSSLSAWKSGTGRDANSLNVDPGYASNTDLHVSNISINGKGMRSYWVIADIDGELRDTTSPDIGADEFFPATRDVGITTLDSPSVFCAGTHRVKIRFQNYGIDTLKSVQIQWQVNAVAQTPVSWTGVLAPGASSASIPLGNYSFAANTPYALRIWTRIPNGLADQKPVNDTLKITRMAGLSGSYTLGDTAGTDFKSFNDAITAMSSRGICGSVTFNVRPGIYNEQITLTQLPGMGQNNPVLFKNTSSDSSRVVITLASTTATGNNNAALQLRGADYVGFRGITFERTGTNPYGHVIHILNGSNANSFTNCRFLGLRPLTSNLNAINIWSDQSQDNGNVFRNCYVKFGTYNVLYTGDATTRESGTVFEGNLFDSAYNYAVNIALNDQIRFDGNRFGNIISPLSGNYLVQLNDCDGALRIQSNHFTQGNAEAALNLIKCNTTSAAPGIIANNAFMKASGRGIYLDSCTHLKMVFNSMYFSSGSGTNAGFYTSSNASANLQLLNNCLYMQGGDVLYISGSGQISASNYNNFYTRGTQFAYWGTPLSNLAALRSMSGMDQNSLSLDPYFMGPLNLHLLNPGLKGAGIPVAGVSRDFDGELRDTLTPDIGADEFKLADLDAGITQLYKPFSNDCAAVLPIEVVIKNYGGDTLTSADIHWTAAGVPQTTFRWTGSLLNKQSDTVQIGTYNFLALLNPKFVVWSNAPNGGTDAIRFNDTFSIVRSVRPLPSANAGPDQTSCAGAPVTIGPNPSSGFSYVWNDLDNQIQVGTTARISVSPPVRTTYELIVTSNAFGCSKRDTVVVNVNAKPVANAGPDKSICYGASVQIGAAAQSGFTYSWFSIPSGFSSAQANPMLAPTDTRDYVLRKVNTGSGCDDYDTVRVTVNLRPTPFIQGPSAVCQGVTAVYNTILNTGNTYQWLPGTAQLIGPGNANAASLKWNGSGNMQVQVIEINAAGCRDTARYSVTVNPKPLAKFTVSEVCKGQSTQFTDSSTGANAYKWDFGDGVFSTQRNPVHQYAAAGSFNLVFSVQSSAGCRDTATGNAYVNPTPVAGFTFVKNQQLGFTFTDTSNNGGGNITSWSWEFGDGDTSTSRNPAHTYNAEGPYTVKLCVRSDRGCESCRSENLNAVGVQELQAFGLTLYPNPTSDKVWIESETEILKLELYTAEGRLLQLIPVAGNKVSADMSQYAPGVYHIRVQTADGLRSFSLIRAH